MDRTGSYNTNLAPTKTGEHAVIAKTTGAAAAWDWVTDLSTSYPKGTVFVCLEANTYDCYVRFGPTSTTATTADNGLLVSCTQPGRKFFVDPTQHKYIDVYSPGGAGKLKLQVCSKLESRSVI